MPNLVGPKKWNGTILDMPLFSEEMRRKKHIKVLVLLVFFVLIVGTRLTTQLLTYQLARTDGLMLLLDLDSEQATQVLAKHLMVFL
jgi:hypothetical protein